MQPVASAGNTLTAIWFSGQFQGVIRPQTPIGSLTIRVAPRCSSKWKFFSTSIAVLRVADAEADLKAVGERDRCAHLVGNGRGEVADALLVVLENAPQHIEALLAARQRPGRERLAGGRDGAVDVGGRTERDLAAGPLGRGVDDVERLRLHRIDDQIVAVLFLPPGSVRIAGSPRRRREPRRARRGAFRQTRRARIAATSLREERCVRWRASTHSSTHWSPRGAATCTSASGYPPHHALRGELVAMRDALSTSPRWSRSSSRSQTEEQRKTITENLDLDFAYAYGDKARFRANYFYKTTGLAAVFRTIPTKVLTLEDLRLPAGDPQAGRPAGGAGARDRSDRIRQVDDARRDDRSHQQDARLPHPHHRGSGRVRARRRRRRRSRTARSAPTRRPTPTPSAARGAKTRTSSSSASCGPTRR